MKNVALFHSAAETATLQNSIVKETLKPMQKSEITRLQAYLQTKFGNKKISLNERKEAKDSVEVSLDGEFIGVIYRDEDEGEISYDFNMAILEIDLPAAA